MSLRRVILAAVAVLALTGAALGAGVALGSSSSGTAEPPIADASTASVPRSSTKGIKPKTQAYAHLNVDGTLIGAAKKVVAVAHPAPGVYCIQLHKSLHVNDNTIVLASIDYYWSLGDRRLTTQTYSYSPYCAGFLTNSFGVFTGNASTGAGVDASFFFVVP